MTLLQRGHSAQRHVEGSVYVGHEVCLEPCAQEVHQLAVDGRRPLAQPSPGRLLFGCGQEVV